ncbi:origin recognition complex subunit 5, partial [Phenoliferia sp. Uapishka_3]
MHDRRTTLLPMTSHSELVSQLPTLAPLINSLAQRLSSPNPPSSIFIHAPTNSNLVIPLLHSILKNHLSSLPLPIPPTVQSLLPKIASIDLEEQLTTKAAFDRVMNTFSGWSTEENLAPWNEQAGAVLNWDGRTEGCDVRQKKRARNDVGGGRSNKRVRREGEEDSWVSETEDEQEDKSQNEGGDEDEVGAQWSLRWKRDTLPPKDPVGPIRDTLDSFHLGLSTIFHLGTHQEEDFPENSSSTAARRFLIVDHAEMLNQVAVAGNAGGAPKETGMGMTFASTIHRLAELSNLPITTICVSTLGWSKAREGMVGLATPDLLSFPLLASTGQSTHLKFLISYRLSSFCADYVNLLAARYAAVSPSSPFLPTPALIATFRSLASIVYDSFGTTAKSSLDELAYLCAKFWPKWLRLAEQENRSDAQLVQHLKEDFQKAIESIAQPRQSLSIIVPEDILSLPQGFTGNMPSASASSSLPGFGASSSSSASLPGFGPSSIDHHHYQLPASTSTTPLKKQAQNLSGLISVSNSGSRASSSAPNSPTKPSSSTPASKTDESLANSLPILSKWLLVAAFYAGFNPVKSDVINFVKIDESIAKKGKKGRRIGLGKIGSPRKANVRAELTGGKAFPLERLLAIFEAVLPDDEDNEHLKDASQTVDVLMQVNTLINLRLLQRISAKDKLLDGVKLKCRLTRDTVDVLARSVGMKDWVQFLWEAEG